MSKLFREKYNRIKQEIENDPDLSGAGKKKRLDEFEKVKRPEAREIIKELWKMAIVGSLSFKEAQKTAETERKRSLMDTDFTRLLYMAMVAKSQIEGAGISEIKETWENVKTSGDDYLLRAWRETLPGIIRSGNFKDVTNERPGLLEDIAASETEEEILISDGQKAALKVLYEVKADAQELDLTFGNPVHGGSNGGIERRVFSGIHLNGDELETDFEQRIITKPSGAIDRETGDELIARLEKEYQEAAEFIKVKMSSDIDPDFEDLAIYEAEKDTEDQALHKEAA